MSTKDTNDTDAAKTNYRSRWGRFSPAMGWKAFWSEIVIVVLGVMIALAANEAVQNWNWNNKVQDGEIRLREDMDYVLSLAAEQVVTAPCVDAQLSALSQNLMQSEKVLNPATIHTEGLRRFVVRLPNRTNRFTVWNSLLADGTATRFSQHRQNIYGNISESVNRARTANDEANRLGSRLLALGYPMALSDDARRSFLVDIEEMRARVAMNEIVSQQRLQLFGEIGSAPEAKQVEAYLNESGTLKFCKEKGFPLANWRDALKP